MTNKFAFFLTIFILNNCLLYGQKTITGQILNKDNTPSEYITVSIFVKDTLVQSTQTDSLGMYSLTTKAFAENYTLTLSSWGIKVYEATINNFEPLTLTHNVILRDDNSISLGEVTVSGQHNNFQLKQGRFVYSPDISLLKSNSAFDLLQHIPLIKADNNDISLIYKSGTIVYVNNRPLRMPINSLIEYLKTTPADNIKDVEIITNPGSNQEASITGGIINIVLRKNIDEGYKMQVMLTEEQSRVNRQIVSTAFKFHKKNFGLQGGLSAVNYPSRYREKTEIITKNGELQEINSRIDLKSQGVNLNLNLEYSPNEKHFFNLFSSIRYNEPNTTTNSFTDFGNINHDQIDSTTNTLNKDKGNQIRNNFFNASYSYIIDDKGQSLNISTDYLDYSNSQNRYTQDYLLETNNTQKELNRYKISAPQYINAYSVKVDYTLPYKQNTFNMGALHSYNKNDNTYEWYDWDNLGYNFISSMSNKFIHKENISAAYISLSSQWSDKIYTNLGLRGEYTATKSNLIDSESEKWNRNYFRLFPSFSLNFEPNRRWKINYSFSGKIRRPAFWELNPARFYSNQHLYSVNNPQLDNVRIYTQTFSITLNNTYSFCAEYSFDKNDIGQLLLPDPNKEGTNYYGRFNYGDRSSLYIYLISPFRFFDGFWRSDASVGMQYDYFKFKDANLVQYYQDESSWNAIIRISNSFRLSNKQNLWGYLNFRYYSPNIYLTNKNISYPVFDLEFKKMWKNWTFSLLCKDIFDTSKIITSMTSDQNFSPYLRNQYTTYNDSRSVMIRLGFSFGNSKTRSNGSAKIANEEIRDRIN